MARPPRHARHPHGELRDRGGELRERHPSDLGNYVSADSCCGRCQQDGSQIATTPGFPHSARPTGGRRKQRTIVMRTRRNVVTGIAAAALALTAGGIAVGSSGGTPTGMLRRQPGRPRPAPGSPSRGTSPRSSGTSRGRPGIPPWRSGRGRTRQEARTSGPCQGRAGCRAARRAAVPGQVSARAVPVAARAAGTRPGRVPGPGRPPARFTASAWRGAR